MRADLNILLSCALTMACRPARPVASAPACDASSRVEWTVDSALAVCVDRTYQAVGDNHYVRFERGAITDSNRAWFAVHADSALFDILAWPPLLASGPRCYADCTTVDSTVRDVDTLTDVVLESRVGLVSGGIAGFRRQPTLIASGTTTSGRRVLAYAFAANRSTLDTIRRMLATARVASP